MTLFGPTKLKLAALISTVFLLGLSSTGEGFKQELWMYREDGNYLYFHTHFPDLTEYSSIFPKITHVCATGLWLLSSGVNYQEQYIYMSGGKNSLFCTNYNMTTVKSLRHFGANDSTTDAISLYTGKFWFGDEIFVTKAKTDISTHILSLAASGTADWMIYEGKNFDGKSSCYQVPRPKPGLEFEWGYVSDLNITKIGSVFKGCDLNEIQLYRESRLL